MKDKPPKIEMALARLGAAIETKRGDRTLREIEAETGISKSTLSRMERGMPCDLHSFAAALKWTGEDASVILGLRRPDVG